MKHLLPLVFLIGCSRDLQPLPRLNQDCTPGETAPCQCRSGAARTRTCTDLGRLDVCACDLLQISPDKIAVSTGKTLRVAAFYEDNRNSSVTWSAARGTISADGLYTAPADAGDDSITATDTTDTSLTEASAVAVVTLPTRPTIATATSVLASSAVLTAKVDAPSADWTYTWNIFGGQFASPTTGTEVSFIAEQIGIVGLGVVATNTAGDQGPPAEVFIQALAPLDASLNPLIGVPDSAKAGRTHIIARVVNPDARLHYEWSVDNGAVVALGDGSSADVTAGIVGTMTLTVTGVNTAGGRTAEATATLQLVPGGDLTIIAGTAGGPGNASGSVADTRMIGVTALAPSDLGLATFVDSAEFQGITRADARRLLADGSTVAIAFPAGTKFDQAIEQGGSLYGTLEVEDTVCDSSRAFVKVTGGVAVKTWCVTGSSAYGLALLGTNAYILNSTSLTRIALGSTPSGTVGNDAVVTVSDGDCTSGNANFAFTNPRSLFGPVSHHDALNAVDYYELYVVEANRIERVKINLAETTFAIKTVAGNCSSATPQYGAVTVDATRRMFYNDGYALMGRQLDTVAQPALGTAKLVAGDPSATDDGFVNGSGTLARFHRPLSLWPIAGDLLVGETLARDQNNGLGVLRRISGIDLSLASPAAAAQVALFSRALPANMDHDYTGKCHPSKPSTSPFIPDVVTEAPDGGLVFADVGKCQLTRRDRSGVLSVLAGKGTEGGTNGFASQAQLSTAMSGLAYRADGSLLIAESFVDSAPVVPQNVFTIRALTRSGLLTGFAGGTYTGVPIAIDDLGTQARLLGPLRLAYDRASDFVFFSDEDPSGFGNDRLGAVLPDHIVISIYGDPPGGSGNIDGFAGIAIKNANAVFVARDNGADDLKSKLVSLVHFGPDGVTDTVVASMPIVAGQYHMGPYGTGACFNVPFISSRVGSSLAYDTFDDTLYVTDSSQVWALRQVSDAAACTAAIVVGVGGQHGVKEGPLPARLNIIGDMILNAARDLVITDHQEDVIMIARP